MKRPIEFKAKRIDNGEWANGDLISNNGKPFIVLGVIEANEEYIAIEQWQPVDPNTICQFTGLTDKNGVKIFEGDKDAHSHVIFGTYTTISDAWGVEENSPKFCVKFNDGSGYYKLLDSFEVIGNIHD